MKSLVTMSFVLLLTITTSYSEAGAQSKSPKELVEEYWKMETSGGRLTADGWVKANLLHLHPIPPLQKKVIAIVYDDWSVWDPVIKGNKAQVIIGMRQAGRIDSALSYRPPDPRLAKEAVMYRVVLTGKHWVVGSDGKSQREISGPPEWKLEEADMVIWLTVKAAIRYITERRDLTKDPSLRNNAEKTLAVLRKLP